MSHETIYRRLGTDRDAAFALLRVIHLQAAMSAGTMRRMSIRVRDAVISIRGSLTCWISLHWPARPPVRDLKGRSARSRPTASSSVSKTTASVT